MDSTTEGSRSSFLQIPLEIRLRIYEYALPPRNIHVEPTHYVSLEDEHIKIGPPTTEPRGSFHVREHEEWAWMDLCHIQPHDSKECIEICVEPKTRDQISPADARRMMFILYDCCSSRGFDRASAVPPGKLDHSKCHRDMGLRADHHSIRRVCKQTYQETEAIAQSTSCRTSFQFARVRDLFLYSIFLTYSERHSISDIRLNVDSTEPAQYEEGVSLAWRYFCNIFALPWDRQSLHLAGGCDREGQDLKWLWDDYNDDLAGIEFKYNRSPGFLEGNEGDGRGLANDWVHPTIKYGLYHCHGGSTFDIQLGKLRTKQTPHLKLALPLPRLEPRGWDGGVADLFGTETCFLEDWLPDLIRLERQIKTTEEGVDRDKLLQRYDHYLERYFCDEPTKINMKRDMRTSKGFYDAWWSDCGWIGYLMQAQNFKSFDLEYYGEDENRNVSFRKSDAMEVMAKGLQYRFTRMDIGPHPYIMYHDLHD